MKKACSSTTAPWPFDFKILKERKEKVFLMKIHRMKKITEYLGLEGTLNLVPTPTVWAGMSFARPVCSRFIQHGQI